VLHRTKQPHTTSGRKRKRTYFAKSTKKKQILPGWIRNRALALAHLKCAYRHLRTDPLKGSRATRPSLRRAKDQKNKELGTALQGPRPRAVIREPGNRRQHPASPHPGLPAVPSLALASWPGTDRIATTAASLGRRPRGPRSAWRPLSPRQLAGNPARDAALPAAVLPPGPGVGTLAGSHHRNSLLPGQMATYSDFSD